MEMVYVRYAYNLVRGSITVQYATIYVLRFLSKYLNESLSLLFVDYYVHGVAICKLCGT